MTNTTQSLVNGHQVWIDRDGHARRWLYVIGPDSFGVNLDFHDEPVVSSEYTPRWTLTKVQAGAGNSTFGPYAAQGSYGRITSDNADGDGVNAQFGNSAFKLTSTAYLYLGARYLVDESTQSKFFIGLSKSETNILGTPSSDLAGFRKADASTSVAAVLGKNSTETTVAGVLTQDNAELHTVELFYDGPNRRVYFFVDAEETTRMTTFSTVPDDELLYLSVQFQTGEAVSHTMDLDWLKIWQIGRV